MNTILKHFLFQSFCHASQNAYNFCFLQFIYSMENLLFSWLSNCTSVYENNVCIWLICLCVLLSQQRPYNLRIILIHLTAISFNMKCRKSKLFWWKRRRWCWLLIEKLFEIRDMIDCNFCLWERGENRFGDCQHGEL